MGPVPPRSVNAFLFKQARNKKGALIGLGLLGRVDSEVLPSMPRPPPPAHPDIAPRKAFIGPYLGRLFGMGGGTIE